MNVKKILKTTVIGFGFLTGIIVLFHLLAQAGFYLYLQANMTRKNCNSQTAKELRKPRQTHELRILSRRNTLD